MYEQGIQDNSLQDGIVGNYPMSYLPPEVNQANLILQTDPSSEISIIEHKLRAEYWDAQKQEWVKAEGVKPFMNEEGIFYVITRLNSVITNNTRFSNLKDLEISQLVLSLADEITIFLSLNWKNYEINKTHLRTIVNMICNMTFLILKRAMNDGERRMIGRTTHSNETRVEHINQLQQRKRGAIAKIFGR